MSDTKRPYSVEYSKKMQGKLLRIAALASYHERFPKQDPECVALQLSANYYLSVVEQLCIHGKLPVFVSPALYRTIENDLAFFECLADPELIEWLKPLVMARSQQPAPQSSQT